MAVDQYMAAFRKDVAQLDRVSVIPLLETFRKAGRLDVLLDFFAEREVPGSLSSYVVGNLLQESLGDDRLRDRAIDVFRKYWKANPAYQMTLLSYINSDLICACPRCTIWRAPAILSRNPALASVYAQWEMFEPMGWVLGGTGQAPQPSPATRLLDLADSRGQLDDLAAAVESARKSRSGWPAADFYRAMIACRAGRYDEARALVRKLADPKTRDDSLMSSIYPFFAFMAVGGELEAHPATTDDAIVLYEWATSLPYSPTFVRYGLEQHPISRLIRLHERAGRIDDVRRVALAFARNPGPSTGPEELNRQSRIYSLREMARKLADLGYAADALTLYSEALPLAEQIRPDSSNYYPDSRQFPKQIREGLESTLAGLISDELAPIAGRSIADASAPRPAGPSAGDEPGSTKDKARDQALDLLTLVYPRALDGATVRSLLAESLAACDADQLAALDEPLEKLRRAHPDDLSVAIATALRALASNESSRVGPARAAGQAGRADAPGAAAARRPGQCPPAGRGGAAGPALAGRPRLREASRLGGLPRRRRTPFGPRPRGGPPPGRQPDDAGDGPRAGREGPGQRRPQGRRGRMGPHARPGHACRSRPDPTTPPRSSPVRSRPARRFDSDVYTGAGTLAGSKKLIR